MQTRSAEATVRFCFERIRARDADVADLFHESGELVGLGRSTAGRERIRAFYSRSIADASPTPELVGELLASGNRVAAEIRISLADGTSLHVVDLFVVDCGLIRLLTYFVADEV